MIIPEVRDEAEEVQRSYKTEDIQIGSALPAYLNPLLGELQLRRRLRCLPEFVQCIRHFQHPGMHAG